MSLHFQPDRDFGIEVAKGNVPLTSHISKFGEALDIDTADGVVDVWDGIDGTLGTGKITSYTYSTTADIDSLSSSNSGDTGNVEVHGLDSNFDIVIQTITLSGQTRVALTTDLIRVYRMINVGSSDIAGDVYCYVNGAITAGVPNTAGDVRAIIVGGNNQTLMSLYTIPNGKTGYLVSWFASISQKKTQNSSVELRFRPAGEVFQIKHRCSLLAAGVSHIDQVFWVPEIAPARTDIVVRSDSSANDGSITSGFEIVLVDDLP